MTIRQRSIRLIVALAVVVTGVVGVGVVRTLAFTPSGCCGTTECVLDAVPYTPCSVPGTTGGDCKNAGFTYCCDTGGWCGD